MVAIYVAGLPLLESVPSEFQPTGDVFKYIILPFVTAVLIPASKRLIDELFNRVFKSKNQEPKYEETNKQATQTEKGME